MHSLFDRSLLYENIKRYDEWFVTKLLTAEEKICGLTAIDMKNGKLVAFQTKVVIMAAGGAGRIYGHTTNSSINTGDGMALAFNAGAALKDMEMVQFHPTTLPNGNLLVTEAARGEGGWLVNKNNERFLKKYLPEKMELGPRDMVTRAIISEINLGNAAAGPHGPYVDLDIRHLGDKTIKEKLPTVRDLCLQYLNLDPAKHKIPVTPAQHYFMGGIAANINTETTLPGLLAAGETACISIHGANRMGSNSLAECVVFGNRAGKTAAELITINKQSALPESQIKDEEKRIHSLLNNSNIGHSPHESTASESITNLKSEMQKIMDTHAGIIREEKTLAAGLDKIKSLRDRVPNIKLHDTSMIFNTELTSLLELDYMLTICETVLSSAIERKESRGSHFRSDYPNRNDADYLEHTLTKKSGHQLSLTKDPVKITNWQPAARAY
jgi:succinate dehydrogenase / fumarate reductase flavoprotein subunit